MKPIELRGHTRPVKAVKINFDGDLFFSGGADSIVNVWSTYTGERIGSIETSAAVKTIDITNDSSILIVASMKGEIEFFNVDGGEKIGSFDRGYKIVSLELSYGDK